MKYRIRKTIDVEIGTDYDGLFRAREIVGTPDNRPDRDELLQAGWAVQEITTPDEDAPGTLRMFDASGDRVIKDRAGQWHYLYPASGIASDDELRTFTTHVEETDR